MTPRAVAEKLLDLEILFQLKPRHDKNDIMSIFGGFGEPEKEDFDDVGYSKEKREEKEEEEPVEEKEDDKHWHDVVTDRDKVCRYNSWFLGNNPPEVFKGNLNGQIMSARIKDRNLTISMEDVPWGMLAAIVTINCEYITNLDYKGGTLYIATKVGNLAVQIHEITEDQCTA